MRRVTPLIMAACSSVSVPDAGGVESVPALERPAPQRARHSTGIVRLAAIAAVQGPQTIGAAVSQDTSGATRFWPSLDGTREPVVLPLGPAREIVIGRDGDGFAIGALDEAGGVELVRVAPDGAVQSRVQIGADPAFVTVAIANGRVVGLRADQTIVLVDFAGNEVARLAPAFGERIARLVTRGDHVLALIARDGDVIGRWIGPAGWRGDTATLPVTNNAPLALSPSGTHAVIGDVARSALVELASGRETQLAFAGEFLGFIDSDTFATRVGKDIEYHNVVSGRRESTHTPPATATAYVAADGIVIGGTRAQLELMTPERVQYLGYGFASLLQVREAGGELLALDGAQRALVLDSTLQPTRALQLPEDPRVLVDVVPIDGRYVVATHSIASSYATSLIDLSGRYPTQSLMSAPLRPQIRYEPSTDLLEMTEKGSSFLVRLDRDTMRFATWYRVAGAAADVYLVDPARADGAAAIVVHQVESVTTVDEILVADVNVGASLETRRTFSLRDTLHAVDRNGRVYFHDGHDVVVYNHGKEVVRLANMPPGNLLPNSDGTRIAHYTGVRVAMYDLDGAERWAIAAPVNNAVWRGDELVVSTAASAYTLDAETGAIKQRACGWSFGLSALPHRDINDGESICDAL